MFCNFFLQLFINSYFIQIDEGEILGLQLGRARPGSNPAKLEFVFIVANFDFLPQ